MSIDNPNKGLRCSQKLIITPNTFSDPPVESQPKIMKSEVEITLHALDEDYDDF